MSDNLENRGLRDRTRVDVNESWELRYWTERFVVTLEDLKRVVAEVGNSVQDAERRLGAMAGGRSGS